MSGLEKDTCFFGEIFSGALPEVASTGALSEDCIDGSSHSICRVGGCALTAAELVDYVMSFGNAQPRQAIDGVVAPSCAILDVAHGAEQNFGRSLIIIDDLGSEC